VETDALSAPLVLCDEGYAIDIDSGTFRS